MNLPLCCAGLGTKSKGNSNAGKACQWLFMLAMQGGFMCESATVGLELWSWGRNKRKRIGRAQGSSRKQKGRQRQYSELEGHDAVIKTSNEGGCYEYATKEDKRWRKTRDIASPGNPLCGRAKKAPMPRELPSATGVRMSRNFEVTKDPAKVVHSKWFRKCCITSRHVSTVLSRRKIEAINLWNPNST